MHRRINCACNAGSLSARCPRVTHLLTQLPGALRLEQSVILFCLALQILVVTYLNPVAIASGVSFDQLYVDAQKLLQSRESKKALPLYRTLVKMRPSSADARAGYGWVLFDLGQREQGMREVHKSIAINPKNADAHHHLAVMYLQLNRMQESADEFRREFAINPKRDCNCGPVKSILASYPPVKRADQPGSDGVKNASGNNSR